MISLEIPGYGKLELWHIVLDYNGTTSLDGELLPGVAEALTALSGQLTVHVLTADTFGLAAQRLANVPCRLTVLGPQAQDEAKAAYVRNLGTGETVCLGNGRNDRLMIEEARLGIAVIGPEGAAGPTLARADIVVKDVMAALGLLIHPLRLTATLRS